MKKFFKLLFPHGMKIKSDHSGRMGGNQNSGEPNGYSQLDSIYSIYNTFFKKYPTEILIFSLIFIFAFSQLSYVTGAGSNGNVEQWINLTNQMFYGKQDLLFSYGPLYWLTGNATSLYNVYAYWLSIAFISALAAYFWSIIFTLVYKTHAYIYFAIAYFLFIGTVILPAALFLWPFAIVAYLEFSKDKPAVLRSNILFLLGILVALSFYVRFFYGTVALATFGSYFASLFLRERKISMPLFFLAGVFFGYITVSLLIFHDQTSILNYLTINSQLSFGNSVDMTLDVDSYQGSFIAIALVLVLLNIFALFRRRSLFLTFNILLLIFFKIGFSRTDHAHYFGYFVIPVAVVALAMLFDKSKLGRLLFVLVMGNLYYLSSVPVYAGAQTRNSMSPRIDFNIDYAHRMEGAYTEFKLDEVVLNRIGKSTIDIYPYNNEYAFANNLNYWHRPLFQNYMTLTPALDSINQRFFESSDRPKFVLWTAGLTCASAACNPLEGFDQKFVLNEDPLTTSAILLNYHVVEELKGKNSVPVILLEENQGITVYSNSLISTQMMEFDEWYKVPQTNHGVIKLKPELKFTLLGRLKNILFRGSVLKIKYKLVSGEMVEYRTNILNSESGIWVSPLLDSFVPSDLKVDSIMLETGSLNYFEPLFKTSWISLPIPKFNSQRQSYNSVLQTPPVDLKKSQISCEGFIDSINGISPLPLKIDAASSFQIRGWLAISAKSGTTADQTFLTLTDDQGKTTYVLTHINNRADLVATFNQPNLASAGYEALIDASNLKGTYKLGLAGTHKSKLFNCSNYAISITGGKLK